MPTEMIANGLRLSPSSRAGAEVALQTMVDAKNRATDAYRAEAAALARRAEAAETALADARSGAAALRAGRDPGREPNASRCIFENVPGHPSENYWCLRN